MQTEPQIEEAPAIYAAVDKKLKSTLKQHASTGDLHHPKITASVDETPPPLPERPFFQDSIKKAHSSEDILWAEVEEKPKRSGLRIFKKKHRRQLSDGNLIGCGVNKNKNLAPNSGEDKRRHRRSKSQADITEHMEVSKAALTQQSYSEITIPSSVKPRTESDEKPPIRPYLAVDITEPPPTPVELRQDENGWSGEGKGNLPEGWREVEGEDGTYYWHVASGTTQWERPEVATRPKVTEPVQQSVL